MATIKDVARMASVGISTVSRVINETKPVSPEVRARVMRAVEETGYTANPIARGLKISRTNSIVVIVTSLRRLFFTSVLEGITKTAEKYGYSVFISQSNDNLETETELVQSYAAQWVDGIILASIATGADPKTQRYCASLSRLQKNTRPIPVVTLEYPCANDKVDGVVVDHERAAFEAVTHLLEQGKRSIAHITVPLSTPMGQMRLDGYRAALAAKGITPDERYVRQGEYTPISGYNVVCDMLSESLPVDGIFAANDQMAVGALTACKEHALRVPEDVAIIGYDNVFVSSIVTPALSSVDIPRYEMGATAMELLHQRLAAEKRSGKRRIITLPAAVVPRGSTVAGMQVTTENMVNW